MLCDICRTAMPGPGFVGIDYCPNCNQAYEYDEGVFPILDEEQCHVLRDFNLKRNNKD